MTATRASAPPASDVKRDRIWRCRSLSSAPPMISRCPARGLPGPLGWVACRAAVYRRSCPDGEAVAVYTRWMPAVESEVRTEERDYYEVLGAAPSATVAELRAAFRDAVLRHHPDRAPPRWPPDGQRS